MIDSSVTAATTTRRRCSALINRILQSHSAGKRYGRGSWACQTEKMGSARPRRTAHPDLVLCYCSTGRSLIGWHPRTSAHCSWLAGQPAQCRSSAASPSSGCQVCPGGQGVWQAPADSATHLHTPPAQVLASCLKSHLQLRFHRSPYHLPTFHATHLTPQDLAARSGVPIQQAAAAAALAATQPPPQALAQQLDHQRSAPERRREVCAEVVLNDINPRTRAHVIKRTTQTEFERKWNVSITVRGRYYPPGTGPQLEADEKPLYLLLKPGATLPQASDAWEREGRIAARAAGSSQAGRVSLAGKLLICLWGHTHSPRNPWLSRRRTPSSASACVTLQQRMCGP